LNGDVRKLVRVLGVDASIKIRSDVKRVEAGESRSMNEYGKWSLPYISSRGDEHANAKVLVLRRVDRDIMIEEWLAYSN